MPLPCRRNFQALIRYMREVAVSGVEVQDLSGWTTRQRMTCGARNGPFAVQCVMDEAAKFARR
jgi:hypothetical protein